MSRRPWDNVAKTETAATPKPKKAARRKAASKTKAPTPPPIPEKELVGARIPVETAAELRALAAKLQRETGRRVLLTDLVTEAVGLLLKKYR